MKKEQPMDIVGKPFKAQRLNTSKNPEVSAERILLDAKI